MLETNSVEFILQMDVGLLRQTTWRLVICEFLLIQFENSSLSANYCYDAWRYVNNVIHCRSSAQSAQFLDITMYNITTFLMVKPSNRLGSVAYTLQY